MESNYIDVFMQFEKDYEQLKRTTDDVLKLSSIMISTIEKKLKEVNKWLIKYEFQSIQDEIFFFKEIKPTLVSKLIFYKSLLKITSSLPPTKKDKKKHYQKYLMKICDYSQNNKDFYEYYRAKSSYKDQDYFTRHHNINLLQDDCWLINYDTRHCTSHEYNVAMIIANDMLTVYLENKLDELLGKPTVSVLVNNPLNWTASKIDLVELIYALHQSRAINAGAIEVKELAVHFGKMLNIDIDDSIYRTYADIKARKTIRTKFLNTLTDNFNQKMDEEDL